MMVDEIIFIWPAVQLSANSFESSLEFSRKQLLCRNNILRKKIEGYLYSVTFLTFNKIYTDRNMYVIDGTKCTQF